MYEFQLGKDLKNKKIRHDFRWNIEPHEVLLDSLAQKKEKESGISERKIEVPLLKRILKGFFIFCIALMSLLFVKTFQLQIINGKDYTILAEQNKFIIRQIQAERGIIYDKNMQQLVYNQLSFDLICDKKNLPQTEIEKDGVLKEISTIIKKDYQDLKKEVEESKDNYVLIASNISNQELILLETKNKELAGFQIQNNTIREYKDGETFSHIIGYTGKVSQKDLKENPDTYSSTDYVGKDGLEKVYENNLHKNSGELQIERDVLGNVISKEITSLPKSGESLVLWIDADLQKKIQEELKKKMQDLNVKKAVGVAFDPNTGGVLAMVSLPSYDNNLFNKGSDEKALSSIFKDSSSPLWNRVISGQYPTGSSIKPLIASAALQEEIIDPDKQINCQGYIEVPHRYDPENSDTLNDMVAHGLTDLRKALAVSCNVYFYTVGGGYKDQQGLGPSRIKKYLELFGWGKETGVDLLGETTGFIPSQEWKKTVKKENWWDGDTYHLSIGQGDLLATPLQVVSAIAAVANGGKLLQPQIVKKIIDTSSRPTKVVEEFKPTILNQDFISPENLQIVREGMRDGVIYGSSVSLNSLPVKVASKTGTAQTNRAEYYLNWVNVFAPYENPEIVLTIMFEDVYGIQAAALPVAKNVLEWYFTR